MKEAVKQIVDMANKLNSTLRNPVISNEDSDVILIDGAIGICEKCHGEKFEEGDVFDYDGERVIGTEYVCENCSQHYHQLNSL